MTTITDISFTSGGVHCAGVVADGDVVRRRTRRELETACQAIRHCHSRHGVRDGVANRRWRHGNCDADVDAEALRQNLATTARTEWRVSYDKALYQFTDRFQRRIDRRSAEAQKVRLPDTNWSC